MADDTLFINLLRNGRTVARSRVKGRYISTGRDWKCQLVDPTSDHRRQKIITRSAAGFRINLPDEAEGTFTYKGSSISLDDMAAWGLAKRSKRGYLVQHREGMSADIRIGNKLFVLNYGPRDVPEMMVPELVKYGRLPLKYRFQTPNRTDLTFLTLLMLILLAHIAGVNTLRDFPIPEVTAIKELPRRISRLILEPAIPPPSRAARKGEATGESKKPAAEMTEEAEPSTAKPKPEASSRGETPAPVSREAIRSQVSKMGVVGVLTGRGTAGRKTAGANISVLQLDKELQQDLENVLGEISGITTAAPVSGTGGDAGFDGTESGSGIIGIEGQLSEANVSGPIQVSRLGTIEGLTSRTLDGSSAGEAETQHIAPEQREERSNRTIARVVAAHTGAIRYAYNRELRKKPSLRGKIVLTFTISPDGEVIQCHIEESAMNWPPLENSLVKIVKTWTFPQIPEGDVTVSYPLVFFPSM